MNVSLGLLLILALPLRAAAGDPDLFFLAIGNAHYRQLPLSERKDSQSHEFGDIPGAGRSARRIAELLARRGARGGILLLSATDRYITYADVNRALARLLTRAARFPRPFVVIYFAGHGISEGIGWNHFSVPGDFAGHVDFTDLLGLARRTFYAGDLADRLDKHKVRYLLLLDSCYEGQPMAVPPDLLAPKAAESLVSSIAPLRFINEFHQSNPVVYSAAPGTIVPTVADPIAPESVYLIGPLARRALIATHDGSPQSLESFVAALLDRGLDTATSPALSWADLHGQDQPFLRAADTEEPSTYQTVTGRGRPGPRENP